MATYFLGTGGYPSEAVKAKTEDMLAESYQRMLTFQTSDGGFALWQHDSTGKSRYTAYGLAVLTEMAQVRYVDPKVLQAAVDFLETAQGPDGTWGDTLETAMITWSLASAPGGPALASSALATLQATAQSPSTPTYTKALIANAIAAHDPQAPGLPGIIAELAGAASVTDDQAHWDAGGSTFMNAWGDGAAITTTGLVGHLLLVTESEALLAEQAAAYLVAQKQEGGTWGSTEATVSALRALSIVPISGLGTVDIDCNGQAYETLVIDESNADLLHMIDLDACLGGVDDAWSFAFAGFGQLAYQFEGRYHTQGPPSVDPDPPFDVAVVWDEGDATVGTPVVATVTATNTSSDDHGMTIVGVPVPLGATVNGPALDALVADGTLQEWEVRDGRVILYVESLPIGAAVEASIEMTPSYAIETTLAPTHVYSYYNPTLRAETAPASLVILAE